MQWLDLLNRIPSSLFDSLALGLVTGGEVVVQQLIRMEKDFVIVRGRMAGSTAEGRVLIVPYSHLTMVAFNKHMVEKEVQEIFGRPSGILNRPSAAPAMPAMTEERIAVEPAPAETATLPVEMPAAAALMPSKPVPPKAAPP
jgi:hypothetical protein